MGSQHDAEATRRQILQAVAELSRSLGATGITLDAVARQAGVSKGGLLYHYPSKDALVLGLVAALVEEFEADIARRLAAEPDPAAPGAWLRAYIRASVEPDPAGLEMTAGLLAVIGSRADMQTAIRPYFEQWHRRALESDLDQSLTSVILLALDGLLLCDLLQVSQLDAERRGAVARRLLQMAGAPQ